jgi:hypothetical protein
MERPSPRFIKHGWLGKNEYNPNLHNVSVTMDERNIKTYEPRTTYYTENEMNKMKQEIKIAECPICFAEINDDSCRVCKNGHKFHNICPTLQNKEVTICPVCRNTNIGSCNNIYTDITSGGKKYKHKKSKKGKKGKKRKINKKTRKLRKIKK